MNWLELNLEPLTTKHHAMAVGVALLSVMFRVTLMMDGILEALMAGFWAAGAYYCYAIGSNIRYQGVQSVVATLSGISLGAVLILVTL